MFSVSDDDEVVVLNCDALSSFQKPIFRSVYTLFEINHSILAGTTKIFGKIIQIFLKKIFFSQPNIFPSAGDVKDVYGRLAC